MRKIKKIMLIQPPVTRPKDFSAEVVRVSVFFPLGLGYLAAVLEKIGMYEVRVLDALIQADTEKGIPISTGEFIRYGLTDTQIEERISVFSPDVVGVACLFSATQFDMAGVCKIAKKINPSIITVTGGAHAGSMNKGILGQYPEVDFLIIGEAEDTLLRLLNIIESGRADFSHINGLVFRQQGSIKCIPKTEYIEDLDALPFPARNLFDMKSYLNSARSHGFFRFTPYTQMITSRGCPCHCSFCGLGDHWGNRQRLRSARNVLSEIEYLIKQYGIKEIHFEDDNLLADRKRAIELFDGMIKRKFNIKWHIPSGVAVYTLNEDLLEKMKASGCYSVTLAIESGNQGVVSKLMNKPVNLKLVPGLAKKIRELGMDVRGFFIIGYPDETKENIRETIEFAKRIELDWAYFSIASPLPNTPMYRLCLEKGYIKEGDFDPIRSFHRSIIRTPQFSPEYLYQAREEAIIETCFRNNPNLLKYDLGRAIRDFKAVVDTYPHFDFANFYLAEAYSKKGNKEEAIKFYKNTLVANPAHLEAKKRLQEVNAN